MFSQRRTLSALPLSTPQNARTLCVLGVDPAVAGATGYGVVESDGRRCRMLRFGALRPAARRGVGESLSTQMHLCDIHALVAGLIREFAPDGVAIESVFTALNMKTALRLAEVRGVILLAAAQAGVASFSYSPREVKATVAGYGNAGKEQVQQMVRAVLGMSETPEPPDASDALAVALCHVQMAESQQRLAAQSAVICAPRGSRRRNREAVQRVPSLS
jgi:crossover junction endodeoxyribonuclease RuvC